MSDFDPVTGAPVAPEAAPITGAPSQPPGPAMLGGELRDPIADALNAFKAAKQSFDRASGEIANSSAAVSAAQADLSAAQDAHQTVMTGREDAAGELREAIDGVVTALQAYRTSL